MSYKAKRCLKLIIQHILINHVRKTTGLSSYFGYRKCYYEIIVGEEETNQHVPKEIIKVTRKWVNSKIKLFSWNSWYSWYLSGFQIYNLLLVSSLIKIDLLFIKEDAQIEEISDPTKSAPLLAFNLLFC